MLQPASREGSLLCQSVHRALGMPWDILLIVSVVADECESVDCRLWWFWCLTPCVLSCPSRKINVIPDGCWWVWVLFPLTDEKHRGLFVVNRYLGLLPVSPILIVVSNVCRGSKSSPRSPCESWQVWLHIEVMISVVFYKRVCWAQLLRSHISATLNIVCDGHWGLTRLMR